MAYHAGYGLHEHGCVCAACCDSDNGHQGERDHRRDEAGGSGPGAEFVFASGTAGSGLISGYKWAETTLTYAFTNSSSAYGPGAAAASQYGTGEATAGFAPLNGAQQVAAQYALDQFASVSGLNFKKVGPWKQSEATLRLAQSAEPSTAWGYYPSDAPEGGDAWFGNRFGFYSKPEKGDYAWHTMLHEIGHTLGLKHGHEGGGGGALPFFKDSMEFSVMTYRSFVGDPMNGGYSNESYGFAQTLMRGDIAAIQELYGANYAHNAGNTVYRWDPDTGEGFVNGEAQGAPGDNLIFMTIWDGGGVDTLNFANYDTNTKIDLRPGAGSIADRAQLAELNANEPGAAQAINASANVYLAYLHEGDRRALIENAVGGSGDDRLIGNGASNRLAGGQGDDRLAGGWGGDVLLGGAGDDRLIGGAGWDRLAGGRGDDRLFGGGQKDKLFGWSGDDVLAGGQDSDLLAGGAGDDRLFGGAAWDILKGGAGADRLSGGGGADALRGGAGRDVFVFNKWSGDDRVLDFQDGIDRFDVSALNTRMSAIAFEDTRAGLDIAIGDVSIFVRGADRADITFDDFIF